MSRGWDQFLTEQDKQVYALSGYGERAGFGLRPVLLVVDVNNNFCGDVREPILESAQRWRNSCGEAAWDAMEHIQRLLAAVRERGIPTIYTTSAALRPDRWDHGRWPDKNRRGHEDATRHGVDGNLIREEIAPIESDIVIHKSKPSAFHGTMLESFLTDLQADSVIIAGTTTSGCVRASVLDAFSYNYKVAVVEEATFDRGQASHWINLFDMDLKYADVVTSADTIAHLESLPKNLFSDRMPSLDAR